MGVYSESHYVHGQHDYKCAGCGGLIRKHTRHLVYSDPVARYSRICEPCSVSLDGCGRPRYECRAVDERLARDAHAAAMRERYPKPKD